MEEKEGLDWFKTKTQECIITGKYNCPHEIISGKICSSCKVPDTTRSPFTVEY
jgi:hypothetical protein